MLKEGAAILISGDEAEEDVGTVNMACLLKAVPFMNSVIVGAQMEMTELEQLPAKTVRRGRQSHSGCRSSCRGKRDEDCRALVQVG
ncbi:unnamed protein product [Prunus armeniaca]|uniref:Uncharacterized protein n=1 Tax=Prunus armeniaca TaxID=36596 RepID=A0A6J5UXE1_PRUAR|nr:unnamed protein product [Prunus armeniaca]CAB4308915.1 unnamed protein product [Prunus armeniaca]